MNTPDEQWWVRARQARDKLAAQVLNHPNVSLVDIGDEPTGAGKSLVLRVHIRQGDLSGLDLPDAVDGIPVRVIRGDYKLQ